MNFLHELSLSNTFKRFDFSSGRADSTTNTFTTSRKLKTLLLLNPLYLFLSCFRRGPTNILASTKLESKDKEQENALSGLLVVFRIEFRVV